MEKWSEGVRIAEQGVGEGGTVRAGERVGDNRGDGTRVCFVGGGCSGEHGVHVKIGVYDGVGLECLQVCFKRGGKAVQLLTGLHYSTQFIKLFHAFIREFCNWSSICTCIAEFQSAIC